MVTQESRNAGIETSLGKDVLVLSRLTVSERLGRLFSIEAEVLSKQFDVSPDDLVGEKVCFWLQTKEFGTKRFFNGIVSSFSREPVDGKMARYQLSASPWMWLLTQRQDCRIFQEMTVEDILRQVFDDAGFGSEDYQFKLSSSFPARVFCVQYRESDFNFVSRLMEEEGMYYFYLHSEDSHKLVITDSMANHEPAPGYETAVYWNEVNDPIDEEYVYHWRAKKTLRTGKYSLNDFDFEKPKAYLESQANNFRDHALAKYEKYDYPGGYIESGAGSDYAQVRIEEMQADHHVISALATARGLAPGYSFELSGHDDAAQNTEYLIVGSDLVVDVPDYQSGETEGQGAHFQIEAIPKSEVFRSARVTPVPVIRGPQTATVVGPSGEEIYVDKYGRVKLQFHWDRYGKSDENSSCWIRVSHAWAGKTWGAIYTPRIGQEVIVEFLEGDPDQPIITGRVYNNDNMPPYDLPGEKTKSTLKSNSSKGGSPSANFNEIRFEDKKGSEEVYIHAEKDQNNVVENDETTDVGRDRSETVGRNETISIGENRTEDVKSNESITIGDDRTESVGKNESISIGDDRDETVGKNESITIGKDRKESVGANESVSIKKKREHTVGEDDLLDVGKNLAINAGDSIVIKTGKASITMKKDGTIQISGKDITVKGSGAVNVNASKDVVLKGSKVLSN